MQRSGRVWLGEEWDHQGLAAYSLALGWLETPLLALHLVSLSRTTYAALQPECRFLAQSRCVWVFGSFLPWEQCSWVTVLWLVSWSPENRKGQKMHLSQYQGHQRTGRGEACSTILWKQGCGPCFQWRGCYCSLTVRGWGPWCPWHSEAALWL